MSRYVPDTKTQRWVVIAPSRTKRPEESKAADVKSTIKICPFCEGNESTTPPEVYRIGEGNTDDRGWQVRVVPNKFPITDIHEVIIHSPDHEHDLENLELRQVERVFQAYRDRYRAHELEGQVLIFCNHGFHAGASLAHPHSQLVVIPKQINLDALVLEPKSNIVESTDNFYVYCPDFSQWPYETWIAPKISGHKFSDVDEAHIGELSSAFQRALKKIEKVLSDPLSTFKQANGPFVYNFYVSHDLNWFIRITPRAVHRAGFELGTGLSVNVVDPQMAADQLTKV